MGPNDNLVVELRQLPAIAPPTTVVDLKKPILLDLHSLPLFRTLPPFAIVDCALDSLSKPAVKIPTPLAPGPNQTHAVRPQQDCNDVNGSNSTSNADGSWYCSLCKKKMGSMTLMERHQASARHKKAAQSATVRSAKAARQAQATDGSESEPALLKVKTKPMTARDSRQSDLIEAQQHVAMALEYEPMAAEESMQLYLKAAPVLAINGRTREAAASLIRLVELTKRQAHGSTTSAQQAKSKIAASVKHTDDDITARVEHTANLMLARLWQPYNNERAIRHYKAALTFYWPASLLKECEEAWSSLPSLIAKCQKLPLPTGRGLAASHHVLHEVLGCAGQSDTAMPLAVVLAALNMVLVKAAQTAQEQPANDILLQAPSSAYQLLAQTYYKMGCFHWAADCLLEAWLVGGMKEVFLLAEALGVSIAIDDEVRSSKIERLVEKHQAELCGPSGLQCVFLAELCRAQRTNQWDALMTLQHQAQLTAIGGRLWERVGRQMIK